MNKILSPAAAAAPDRSALLHQFADLDSAAQLSFLVAAMLVHGGGPGGTTLKLMCGKFGVHGPADRSTPAGGRVSTGGRPSLAFIAWLGLRLLMKRAHLALACWLAGTTVAEVRR